MHQYLLTCLFLLFLLLPISPVQAVGGGIQALKRIIPKADEIINSWPREAIKTHRYNRIISAKSAEIVDEVITPEVIKGGATTPAPIEKAILDQFQEPIRGVARAVLEKEMIEEQVHMEFLIKELQQRVKELQQRVDTPLHLDLKANTLTFGPYQIEDVTGKLKTIWTKAKYFAGGGVGTMIVPRAFKDSERYVNTLKLNLRSGPGTEYGIITRLKQDDSVFVLERKQSSDGGSWVKVRAGSFEGWVSERLLSN